MTIRGTAVRKIEVAPEFDAGSVERALARLEAQIRGQADLMARRQLRESLIDVEEALTALGVARQELTSVVAHDVKNLLSVMLMSAAMVGRGDATKIERHVMNIQRTGERIQGLIEDFMDFMRIESGRLALDIRPQDARELVIASTSAVRPTAAQKRIGILIEEPRGPLTVACDRERVARVLSNLLAHAVKLSAEGATVRVGVDSGRDKDARFHVRGMGAETPRRLARDLFDPYRQALNPARKGSAELGIAISKGIIEAQGGRMWVEASAGGSRFAFTLPLAPSGPR